MLNKNHHQKFPEREGMTHSELAGKMSLIFKEKDDFENQNMFKKVRVIQGFGSEAQIISRAEALGYEPNVILNQKFITRSPMDGVINPVQAIKQMIQRIQGKGGTVIYPVEFLGLEKNKMGITAKTSHGLIKADKIILSLILI